ncbi:MAG: hypothetical protein CVU64_19140 [Deltaproteobacteria bacterium HGW-Deltaproteobacteria-21]|nr:MAG: hypothetical protein CVU64_19140 [Deltaproteobacteria bacterium HGW-Deltaproteobacteria-21]
MKKRLAREAAELFQWRHLSAIGKNTSLCALCVSAVNVVFLLTACCLLLTPLSLAQEKKIDVTFGRIVVESFGVDGERVRSFVDLYDSEGQKVGGGRREREGETVFHVREGTYSARVIANNSIDIESIRVKSGQETRVKADFGRLTLSFNDPGKFAIFMDSTGVQVMALGIGKTGRLSAHVRPGTYRIQVHTEPRKEFENLAVRANRETVAGDSINHPPKIIEITSSPQLINPGQSAKIRVEARDEDGDPLTYSYKPNPGRIEGSGERVIYHAAQGKGSSRISVTVADPHGASDSFDYFISSGDLTVAALTANDEPFNGFVEILDALGSSAASGSLGPTGTKTWRLREGRYTLAVTGDNTIQVKDVLVSTDRAHKADVQFGRVKFESFSVNGERVDAAVDLFDAEDRKVGGGKSGKPGETLFHVAEGTYRASLYAGNHMEVAEIRVTKGQESRIRTDWGKLTLRLDEPGKYANIYESSGRKVLGEAIGKGGNLSCYLRPGTYSAEVYTEPRRQFRDLVVHAGKETLVGDFTNHPPRIVDVSSDPPLIKPGQSAAIRVEATDDDGDVLTYGYSANAGRIEGKGPKVVYHAPPESTACKVTVTVLDPHGGSDTFDYFVTGGELTVRALTGRGEPLDGLVQVFNRLGTRVEAQNIGPSGTKTWQLRQGEYSVQVIGDNMVEVPDVEVITDKRRRVDVSFGKVIVESRGVGDERVEASVDLFDSEDRKVGGGKIGKGGETSFSVSEGTYRAVVTARNEIVVKDIQAVPGQATRVRAEWGKLTLSCFDQGKYAAFYDPEGRKLVGETLADTGRMSCHVRPGTYWIEVFSEPKKEFRNLVVQAGQETLAGDFANQRPRVTSITADPPLIKAGQSSRIRVEAKDDDGDPLVFHFEPTVGRIEGSGNEVIYHAPQERGSYLVNIWVSDPHEDSLVYGYFISGGDLTIQTFTGNNEPLDALVHVYDQLETRVESGNTGPSGSRTWRLQEGAYRLEVIGDNTIEVADVNVVTDLDSMAAVNFGKLSVQCFGTDRKPLNTFVEVRTESAEKAAGGRTGEDGVIDFNLRPGFYDISAHQSNVIERPHVQVESQQHYLVSLDPAESGVTREISNRPAIERIVLKPIRTAGPRGYEVSIVTSGGTDGSLSYHYECAGAEVSGSGPKAIIKGRGNNAIMLKVLVRSISGFEAKGEVMIPGVKK